MRLLGSAGSDGLLQVGSPKAASSNIDMFEMAIPEHYIALDISRQPSVQVLC